MKSIGERITFVDDTNKTTIIIEPKSEGWVKGLMGAWVSMWYVIGAIVVWTFLTTETFTDQENIIIFIFLSFWLYYAVKVTRSWFWLLWGRESIKIDEARLIYKKSIFNYGKAAAYHIDNISKFRMAAPKEKSLQAVWDKSPWVKGGESIEFDYLTKVIRFGRKLNEKDATILYKLVTKKVSDRLKKLN